MRVHLREIDQMQTFLQLLSLFCLHLALHVKKRNIAVFLLLSCLRLVRFKDDLVLAVHVLRPVHLVVEFIWVAQFSLQAQLLCSVQQS